MNDPRSDVRKALDQVQTLIDGTRPDQAGLPTPCAEFDVDRLIGHLVGVVARIGTVLSGRPFGEARVDQTMTDWKKAWDEQRAVTEKVLADDQCLTRMVQVPWGSIPGAAALQGYVGELTVHAWDLARATGQQVTDNGLAERVLAHYSAILPPAPREGLPFGPVVEVGPDATLYERVIAWTGRDPRWALAAG